MQPSQSLLRLHAPPPDEFFERFVRPQVPVVLTGVSLIQSLASSWTPDAVARLTGEQLFAFKASSSNAHPNFRASTMGEMFARRHLTFADFFAAILDGPREQRSRLIFTGDEHYLARVRDKRLSISPELAPLWIDRALPPYVPQEQLYSAWAWFSGQGVRTWLHYDNNACHNLNLQVHGRKRCTLFAPTLLEHLAFFPLGGNNPALNCSQLDVEAPEVVASLQRLERYETELNAGDCLFIPAHWIHTVEHLDRYNANLNFWWKPESDDEDRRHPTASANPVVRREAEIRRLSLARSAPVAPDAVNR